jgi:8-oxo-dGTP pyrophosphatase MutT (NUDIX family)
MSVNRPSPDEQLNTGEATEARQAASLILLRDSGAGPEVLLVKRNPEQRFMGGAWVFPGGALQAGDADHAAAAVRELEEEAGVRLSGRAAMVPFSRWITPAQVKTRFDTWFFAAEAQSGVEVKCDGSECVDARWMRPADALAAHGRDELELVFPTIKHLEQLAEFGSVAEALDSARARTVEPVEPKVVVREREAEVLLPGEPGYDE